MFPTSWPAGVQRVAAPAWPALTVEALREHSRVDADVDIALLETYIDAATEFVERSQQRCLRRATWRAVYDAWPPNGLFYVPLPPLASVVLLTYTDPAGEQQTLDTDTLSIDTASEPGRVSLRTLPQHDGTVANIVLTFTAGYLTAGAIPSTTRQAIRLLAQQWYEHREAVVLGGLNEVPFGVQALIDLQRLVSYR